jgi:histidine triad (HIT) family protein
VFGISEESTMSGCIFCKIARNETDSLILCKNETITIFMDINPVSPGHVLVIPNKHFESMHDVEVRYLAEIVTQSKKIGVFLEQALGATGFNVLVANGRSAQQSVFHLHFHVIPRYDNDSIDLWFDKRMAKVCDIREVYAKLRGHPFA